MSGDNEEMKKLFTKLYNTNGSLNLNVSDDDGWKYARNFFLPRAFPNALRRCIGEFSIRTWAFPLTRSFHYHSATASHAHHRMERLSRMEMLTDTWKGVGESALLVIKTQNEGNICNVSVFPLLSCTSIKDDSTIFHPHLIRLLLDSEIISETDFIRKSVPRWITGRRCHTRCQSISLEDMTDVSRDWRQ